MKKILLPAIFLILLLAIFLPRFFIKVKIDCRTQYGGCPGEIVNQIIPLEGKSMFYANRELEKKLKSNFIVSAFSIQFKLPNILRVDLIVKKPIFALRNITTRTLALVDKEGMVLAISEETELPEVSVNGELSEPGERVTDTHLLALELTQGVYKMYQTRTSTIEGDTLLVELPGPIRVIFPLVDADREMLLGSLRLIYSGIQSGEGGALYSQIDLRYKNPVLR